VADSPRHAALAGARVLVTGAAGFIGAACAHALLDAGASVAGCDSVNDYYDPALKQARLARLAAREGFDFRRLDLAERGALAPFWAEARPDLVLHLAAQAGVRYSLTNPHAYTSANVEGTLAVFEAARAMPVGNLLYASSSSVYGGNSKVPFAETDPVLRPVSLYAASKRANELMAQTYAHLFAMPLTGLRFFTVYGPWGRPDMAYYKFTEALFAGREIEVYDAQSMARDFTYVDEVVEAVLRLLASPPKRADEPGRVVPEAPHRIFNIGNHSPERLEALIAILERETGRRAIRRELPAPPGDVLRTYADVAALEAATGFSPQVPLADGLARFVAWYRAHHGIAR
jgi:UDP-glucuronate 4-epimerase